MQRKCFIGILAPPSAWPSAPKPLVLLGLSSFADGADAADADLLLCWGGGPLVMVMVRVLSWPSRLKRISMPTLRRGGAARLSRLLRVVGFLGHSRSLAVLSPTT
jgi:hypothetical protein